MNYFVEANWHTVNSTLLWNLKMDSLNISIIPIFFLYFSYILVTTTVAAWDDAPWSDRHLSRGADNNWQAIHRLILFVAQCGESERGNFRYSIRYSVGCSGVCRCRTVGGCCWPCGDDAARRHSIVRVCIGERLLPLSWEIGLLIVE